MQWLTKLKNQFDDPIDCLRLHIIADNKESNLVGKRWQYSIPPSSEKILHKKQRIYNALQKIYFVQKYQSLFKYCFPFVEFIGVSGSVSSLDAKQNDDIDLFIITKKRRLALSRLIDWLIFNLLKVRRNRQTSNDQYKNKLCCNYYLDNQSLALTKNVHNALEIAELIPIFDRHKGRYYLKLLEANSWVKNFLPQWYQNTIQDQKMAISNLPIVNKLNIFNFLNVLMKPLLDLLEIIVGLPQQLLIKKTLPYYKIKLFAHKWQFWRSKRKRNS